MNINEKFKELAQYKRMSEEIAAVIEGITDEIKQYMQVQGVDVLTGDEHKATYKAVESSRVDTSALKKNAPEIAAAYTVTTSSRRFIFS